MPDIARGILDFFFADLESLAKSVGILATVAAGLWVLFKFLLQKEFYPRLDFKVDIEFVVPIREIWVVALVATITNHGLVRHTFKHLTFSLRGIKSADELEDGGEEILRQLYFPHNIKEGRWFPKSWEYSFVEPGTDQVYRHVAAIPCEYDAVLLHGRFDYSSEDKFHSANKLIKVPAVNTD